ncbi:MAG TPA: NADH-quinone oxidoreductase subunit NuoG, partial [Candidatus Sulfomarinibacteraceae bacterium]|nr:NADH-quinone oxidoreductase subunit NuoG [Candidatus Sulfomarinibacteraceae bacterium]
MGTIYIDGQAYEVDSSKNLLDVCLSLGMDLPYFCWHPAMGSVGACRQCAVTQYRDEDDTKGQIVMACMTPAADGTRISLKNEEAVEFRESVIEWLMVNHPHDCPICDEGGECHLQDMTVMTGHVYRRFRFKKRTHRNQYLGPFINHEMNRCIQCYRCVRFYRDYADGRDFDVFGAHDDVYFGRHEEGVLESEFSGNLVEVCPTGVFTDKTLKKHYTRKWDLQTAPSVCTLCSVGCNTIPGERYGHLRRVRARFNHEVNGYFICDRGRYGYEFVNSLQRIRYPRLRNGEGATEETAEVQPSSDAVLAHLSDLLAQSDGVLGIGSPRASLESNFALHHMVGEDRFCSGMDGAQQQLVQRARQILQEGPARSASLRDIAESDAVLVLGEDLTNTAPMMAYAVRQAVRNKPWREAEEVGVPSWNDYAIREIIQEDRGPLFLGTGAGTKLEDVASFVYHAAPADQARLGWAVAHLLDSGSPAVPDLDEDVLTLAQRIAETLQQAQQPVVISGASDGSAEVMDAAAAVAAALGGEERPGLLALVTPDANSMGLALMGGIDLQEAQRALQDGAADTVVIV